MIISESRGESFLRNWECVLYHLAAFSSETERPDLYGRRQGRKYWDSDTVVGSVIHHRGFKGEEDRLEQHILFFPLRPPSAEQLSNVFYVCLSFEGIKVKNPLESSFLLYVLGCESFSDTSRCWVHLC